MAFYTVHRPDDAFGPAALERAVIVKDGFSWPAFLVPVLWLLWNRLWLGLLAFVVVGAALAAGGRAIGLAPLPATLIALLLSLYVGLEGNALRRLKLDRTGFSTAGVVGGASRDDAERNAVALLAGQTRDAPFRTAATPPQTGRTAASPYSGTDVLGVFPEPATRP